MLISDWSPDVFSSDLRGAERFAPRAGPLAGSGKKSRSRDAADVAGRVVGPLRAVAMSRTAAPAVAAVLLRVFAGSAAGSAAWAKPERKRVAVGMSVAGSVVIGGRRSIKKHKRN